MALDTMMATLDLVAKGEWVTIVPGCLVINDIESVKRTLHPIEQPIMSLDYVLVEQASRTLSPAAQLLRDALLDALAAVCQLNRTRLDISADSYLANHVSLSLNLPHIRYAKGSTMTTYSPL